MVESLSLEIPCVSSTWGAGLAGASVMGQSFLSISFPQGILSTAGTTEFGSLQAICSGGAVVLPETHEPGYYLQLKCEFHG